MFFKKVKQKKINRHLRTVILALIITSILFAYSTRLASMQIVNFDEYRSQANFQSARTAVVKAARGEILDRYGRPIAINRDGYNIVFDASFISFSKLNDTINTLVNLLSANNETWRDKLPITTTEPYKFSDSKSDEGAISNLKSKLKLNHYATAKNCYDAMVEKYKLEQYSAANQRIIMGVRYTMDLEDFSVSLPYTFAEDISENIRAKIKESSHNLLGVNVDEVPIRDYVAGDIAPHIIGSIGPIYAEHWGNLKDKGYSYNDYLGKSGVEAAFENYLRGKDGVKRILQDNNGDTVSVVTEKEAVPGNTVMLTIDSKVQKVAQDSLAKLIKGMQADGLKADSGAVVAINVNNGEIIASANYPSFTLDSYKNNYSNLAKDKTLPLFDRAFNGTYPPGSTFKPAVAAIGLQTSNIKKDETINCVRYYTYYKDMTYRCMGYHGHLDVEKALSKSCNYFFYETGRRIGIDTLNSYNKLFGFGVKTGVEVPEAEGVLAGPEYAKKINQLWNPGDTLQAAIGQSYNLFTPLQLATYTATVANGGTRYQSHLLHQVKSYNLENTVVAPSATIAAKTGIAPAAMEEVKKGMLSAAFEGTASSVFRNYKIKVGGKTGTAQTVGDDNGVFIAFGPYDNPEIAVAILVEHGLHGYTAAPVVRDIFDAYFFSKNEVAKKQPIGKLLP